MTVPLLNDKHLCHFRETHFTPEQFVGYLEYDHTTYYWKKYTFLSSIQEPPFHDIQSHKLPVETKKQTN